MAGTVKKYATLLCSNQHPVKFIAVSLAVFESMTPEKQQAAIDMQCLTCRASKE